MRLADDEPWQWVVATTSGGWRAVRNRWAPYHPLRTFATLPGVAVRRERVVDEHNESWNQSSRVSSNRLNQFAHQCLDLLIELWSDRNRFSADDGSTDCRQRIAEPVQSAASASRPRHGCGDGDDFPFELAGADHPVDGIFQDTR